MKATRINCFALFLLFSVSWAVPLYGATSEQYVGRWTGDVSAAAEGESDTVPIVLQISLDNGALSGTIMDDHTGIPQSFQGGVVNGKLVFQWPNMDPDNPDCANWDLPTTASLDGGGSKMHLTASGTVCGRTGGKSGSVVGYLTRQRLSMQPVLSMLLQHKNNGTEWFFSGSDIGGQHSWYGITTLNTSGTLLDGTLNSSSGAAYTLIGGQLSAGATGGVVGSLTDSDSTTTEFSMQRNGQKNIMAGRGKAVGESENGLFIFVKKTSGSNSTDLQEDWFMACTDLVAHRTCGGTVTFAGLTGLENFRSGTGTVECTDGSTRTYQGGTLGSLVVNYAASSAPGNVTGSFQETSGRRTNLTLQLNEQEKVMAGYGKGASDTENGLYVFIKKTTDASVASLAGDWFVSNSDLFGNQTWEGVFSFNSSGGLTSGFLTSTNGGTWTFTSGSLTVDSSGQVTGSVIDTVSSVTEFKMQLNEQKDLMAGPGFATSDHDNGLFIFVKK